MKKILVLIIVVLIAVGIWWVVKKINPKETVVPSTSTTTYTTTTTTTQHVVTPASNSLPINRAAEIVAISNFTFSPNHLIIKKGTKVTWTNNDSAPHTVTGDSTTVKSSTLAKGDSFSYTFDDVGIYDYHCSIHPSMTGTVEVTE